MARKKEYKEEEVIEKAMHLFWRNGYEKTSMQMLEKEMGINKFSIYSSFGSKHGLFMESIKAYQDREKEMFERFINATNGVADIKAFFYDSVRLRLAEGSQNGCLLTNSYNEFSVSDDEVVKGKIDIFMDKLKSLFIDKLRMDKSKDEDTIRRQANFLVLAKHGLAAAARVNSPEEIRDYIEVTFSSI